MSVCNLMQLDWMKKIANLFLQLFLRDTMYLYNSLHKSYLKKDIKVKTGLRAK